jgi:hypothetical protein
MNGNGNGRFGYPGKARRRNRFDGARRYGVGRRVSQGRGSQRDIEVSRTTNPLELLSGRRALVLADVQNISVGAEQLGYKLSYRLLAERLRGATRSCSLHAFFAAGTNGDRLTEYFVERGWGSHPYPIHSVRTHRGVERRTNTDFLLAFFAGALVRSSNADVVGICSGDGGLVADVARAIAEFPKQRDVVTLSLAGSTAWALDAAVNGFITANIEIGQDVLHRSRR